MPENSQSEQEKFNASIHDDDEIDLVELEDQEVAPRVRTSYR